MKKYLYILALLASGLSAQAQKQLYVCLGDTCHAFSLEHLAAIVFRADSFQIGQLPAYAIARVDSLTLVHPSLSVQPLGWWGDMGSGQCSYRAQKSINLPEGETPYLVVFAFECGDSICLTAQCHLYFGSEATANAFITSESVDSSGNNTGSADPYIYVKQTKTGPRKFEAWVMDDPVLPGTPQWQQDGSHLQADCTQLLTGRPVGDVRQIVEAWLHQEGTKIPKQTNP